MYIYLSVNNRADILQIPVIPASFTISKPQSTSVFETVSKGELQLIGVPKLKGITITSFFPIEGHDYAYVRNTSMWGWEYVYKIDTWIDAKLPIRLVITDTPINMAVAAKDFQYTVKTDGDLWYSLQLEEFSLLGFEGTEEDEEEEIDMEELNRLKEQVEYLSGVVQELANPFIYNYIDENMPAWAHESVQKLMDNGILTGDGSGLSLTYSELKNIVWLNRLIQLIGGSINQVIYNYVDDNMPEWARSSVQKMIDNGVLSGSGEGWQLAESDIRTIVWLDRLGLLD